MHDEPLRHRTTTALWGRLQSFVRWHGVNTHRATLVTGLTLILLLTITAILAGRVLYDRAIDEWRRELSNLSLILAENTSQAVNSAYLVVNDLAETVAAANIENQAAMGAVFGTEAVFQTLRSQISGLPQISVVTIVGANGNVINFSRSFPAPTISLADRDHFLHHQARRVEGVYLSVPVRNKGDGKWTFYLSRRLENADHQFLGVALVGISCDFFSDFFRNVSIGENAAISLFRRDFTLLAHWPVVEEKLGKNC